VSTRRTTPCSVSCLAWEDLPTLINNFCYRNNYPRQSYFLEVLQSKIEYIHNVVSEP
jgi:hypothetical protein